MSLTIALIVVAFASALIGFRAGVNHASRSEKEKNPNKFSRNVVLSTSGRAYVDCEDGAGQPDEPDPA